jgi:hypothetical protein
MANLPPGTMVHLRTVRRFQNYMAGEMVAFPIEIARELEAKRLAVPVQLFVPRSDDAAAAVPVRQPGGVVRK